MKKEKKTKKCCGMCIFKGEVGDNTKGCADKRCLYYRKNNKK